jgi:hypothetical protein
MKQDFIDKLAESPAKLIPAAFATVIACGICLWFVAIALDAQAKSYDKKIEQQQFYRIIKTTYNQ